MILLRLRALLFVFVLAAVARSESAPAPAKDVQLKLAQSVHDIFEAKCLDCHGPELPRPKGKFGYVLDLKRVADNSKMIVRGRPDDSDLYDMVVHDEMPGEDANVPPLTPAEKDIVKQWIEAGAPHELPAGAEQAVPTVAANAPEVQMPLWKRTLRWIGRFHPVSTHFPVALMFVAVFAEALAWWTRRESWLQTVRLLVVLGALGAIAATALGWVNAYFSSLRRGVGFRFAVASLARDIHLVLGGRVRRARSERRMRGRFTPAATFPRRAPCGRTAHRDQRLPRQRIDFRTRSLRVVMS